MSIQPDWLIAVEERIIRTFVREALKKGYMLRTYDGEEYSTDWETSENKIMSNVGITDTTSIVVRTADKKPMGVVLLIHGNGEEVFADWSDTKEVNELVGKAMKAA